MKRAQMRGIALGAVLLGSLWHDSAAQAAAGSGVLFGTDASRGNLLIINTATGASTIVGHIDDGLNVPSLATDPVTGITYAGGGGGSPVLERVDRCTGAGALIGDTGLGEAAIGALDFQLSGPNTSVLFASVNLVGNGGSGSDHLATIDTTTGVATIIGPYGICMGVVVPSMGDGSCNIEGMEALAFAPDGTLYGAVNRNGKGPVGLYTINTTTGAATFVAPILDSNGMMPGGGVVSLQFALDGTLYAGTSSFMGMGGGNFGTVDPTTGLFTLIGNAVSGGPALGALAFGAACGAGAPAVGSLNLIVLFAALCAAGIFLLRRSVGQQITRES